MAVKNTFDGSFTIDSGSASEIIPTTLEISGIVSTTLQSFYVKVGTMCILYIPSFTQTPPGNSPANIYIGVDMSIIPKYGNYIVAI